MSLFRRIKNELGDNLLKFAVAKSDNITSLEMYRERSEPTFLFFAVSRQLVASAAVTYVTIASVPGLPRSVHVLIMQQTFEAN